MYSIYKDWKVHIDDNVFSTGYHISIYRHNADGGITLIKIKSNGNIEEVKLAPGIAHDTKDWSFYIPLNNLQPFMKALWDRGIRPDNERYEKEIDLLKNHIKDLQKIIGVYEDENKT